MSFVKEFFDFLKTFGIIGLAIAFVIGVASSGLINAFVADIINPLIGLFLPAGSLDQLSLEVPGFSGGTSTFMYGHLISTIINFLIIALIVFIAYKQLSKMGMLEKK